MSPTRLSELIGQSRAATVLRNAIRRDRVAHAYLFRGPAGVGKSTAARLFAQALNCDAEERETTGEPCGECRSCRFIAAGSHPDVRLLTTRTGDERSVIPIEEMRQSLVYDTNLKPVLGRYKVYLLDPADRTAPRALETVLKTLEEPPPKVVVILVTALAAALPPTVLSRCQQVSFQLVGTAAVAGRLEEMGVEAETAASLAALSGGRVAWAISAARRPELLEARQELLALCGRAGAMGVAESLRFAEEVKRQAVRLVQAKDESEEDEEEEAAPERVSADRALRVELPWCLDVMAWWHRDRLAEASGARAKHHERAVQAILATKHYLQRNANIDLALEALAIHLLIGGTGEAASKQRKAR